MVMITNRTMKDTESKSLKSPLVCADNPLTRRGFATHPRNRMGWTRETRILMDTFCCPDPPRHGPIWVWPAGHGLGWHLYVHVIRKDQLFKNTETIYLCSNVICLIQSYIVNNHWSWWKKKILGIINKKWFWGLRIKV